MGGAGFEPAKAVPPDLQSGPFGRLGIHPGGTSVHGTGASLQSPCGIGRNRDSLPRRDNGRAGGESRTHNRRFTKPVLCRLSYASDREAVKFPNIPPKTNDARDLFSRATETKENRRVPGPQAFRHGRRFSGSSRSGPSRLQMRPPPASADTRSSQSVTFWPSYLTILAFRSSARQEENTHAPGDRCARRHHPEPGGISRSLRRACSAVRYARRNPGTCHPGNPAFVRLRTNPASANGSRPVERRARLPDAEIRLIGVAPARPDRFRRPAPPADAPPKGNKMQKNSESLIYFLICG
jgi:hypothetical protein